MKIMPAIPDYKVAPQQELLCARTYQLPIAKGRFSLDKG